MLGTDDMILPTVHSSFEWRESRAGAALVCRPFEAVASHVFTTRQWALGSPSHSGNEDPAWDRVADMLNVEPRRLVRVRQVHGAGVAVVRAGRDSLAEADIADIIVTDDRDVALAIRVADCVPLLVGDLRRGVVAAAHAGWRGLAARVPETTIRALEREYGSRAQDLVVVAGPSIGACCYEVGKDVRDRFAAGFNQASVDRWFQPAPIADVNNPPLPGLHAPREGHWFFDGWLATRDQLLAAGVDGDRVFNSGLCTASHPALFCSYRRDGAPAGRLAAAIRALGD